MKFVMGNVLRWLTLLFLILSICKWWQISICPIFTSSHVLKYIATLTLSPNWSTAVAITLKMYLWLTGIDFVNLTSIFLTVIGHIVTSISSPSGSRAFAKTGKLYSHATGVGLRYSRKKYWWSRNLNKNFYGYCGYNCYCCYYGYCGYFGYFNEIKERINVKLVWV